MEGTATQQSPGIYASTSAKLGSRFGETILKRLSNCASTWGTHGDTHLRWHASKHSQVLLDSSKLPNTYSVTPDEITHAWIEANLHSLWHTWNLIYRLSSITLPRTMDVSYANYQVCSRTRTHWYIIIKLNSRTLAQSPTRKKVLTKALLRINSPERTNAWKHVVLHELTLAATHLMETCVWSLELHAHTLGGMRD
jgi:hypothetical protein